MRAGWPHSGPTSARGLLATHVVRYRRPGRRLLRLGGGQPQQQSCGTRATREVGEQQLQAPQRVHVVVVSVRR